jgi:hypothetical protein
MKQGSTTDMRARRAAAAAVLHAYREGRPIEELRTLLPVELEATGQKRAAEVLRSFFMHAALNAEPHLPTARQR